MIFKESRREEGKRVQKCDEKELNLGRQVHLEVGVIVHGSVAQFDGGAPADVHKLLQQHRLQHRVDAMSTIMGRLEK